MILTETNLKGTFIIEVQKLEDQRGFFSRAWCQKEFEAYGLSVSFVQCNINFSKRKGTLRGLHYQVEPYEEIKLIRCTKGSIYDVVIDLRPGSATYRQWIAVELTADNHKMLYVPEGFAHGFQTLDNNVEIFYQMSEFFHEECRKGVRWDDPSFQIKWALPNPILSASDRSFKDFK